MKPRERVLTALEHQQPDRVPVMIGGSAGKLYESMALRLMDHFGLPREKLGEYPAGFKFVPYADELWEALEVDVRLIYPNSHANASALLKAQKHAGVFVNKWGSKFQFTDPDGERPSLEDAVPLASAESIDDLDRHPWPRPGPDYLKGLRQRAEDIRRDGRYATVVHRPLEAGIFGCTRYFLRGTEEFFCDMAGDEEFAEALLRRVTDTQKAYYGPLVDEIGDLVDIFEIEDDLGMQDRPMISPESYRKLIKPRHAELIGYIKAKAPHAKVMMHSDGAIRDLIPDFIDVGVDILNPLQIGPKGMIIEEIKKEFGERISFSGAVDVQLPFLGKVDTVRKLVRDTMKIMGPGGGYIMSPTHNFSPDIPLENVLAMFSEDRRI